MKISSTRFSIRLISAVLCLAMMLVCLPQDILADVGEMLSSEPEISVEDEIPSTYVLGEMPGKRTAHTKTFRMSDGSFVLADYTDPVHFENASGGWTDYDNTLNLVETDSFIGYENTASDVRTRLSLSPDDNGLVILETGPYVIRVSLQDADSKVKATVENPPAPLEGKDIRSATTLPNYSSSVSYADIQKDTDLEYILFGNDLKENIVVRERSDDYAYSFEMHLEGLVPTMDEDGSVLLKDILTGEDVFVIPAGFMTDANGEFSSNVSYTLETVDDGRYLLTVLPDPEWLNDEGRVFPVTVDPSFRAAKSGSDTLDNHVSEQNPNTNYYIDTHLFSGNRNGYKNEILFMAKTLSPLPPTATVINATCMFRFHSAYAGSRTDGIKAVLLAYPIVSQWDTLTVTWNTRPTVSAEALDFETFYNTGSETYIYYDITRLAQDWYHGSDNYGFALKVSGTTDGYVQLYSSDRSGSGYKPKLTIEYRDTRGLDDRWTFASQSTGEAGRGYVNGFNGNLVYVHHDKTTKGNILPVTVSHVFNAANANEEFSSSMPVGKGWKLSVQETIAQETIDTATWYRYSDGDGTDLYFMEQSSSVYVSEDGLGLTLTFGSGSKRYCLTDDYGNKKYFNTSGNLSSIVDVNGNVKTFTYSSDKLTSISYTPNGSSTPATQLTFDYYTNGAVKTITDGLDSTDYVTFKYSSTYNGNYSTSATSGYLRSITYSKGGGVYMGYTSEGNLSHVTDNDTNRSIQYTYEDHSYTATNGSSVTVYRVSKAKEEGFDNDICDWPAGQTVQFAYADKQFIIRTSGTDDIIGNTDDLLTTYLFNNEGKEICAYTGNVYSSAVYGASNTKYEPTEQGSRKNGKITSYSAKGANAFNLLTNGNLENSSGWTNAASGSGYSSSFSTADSFLGNKSLKLYSTFGGTGYTERSATVSIPSSGTYTFSAYVKTDSLTLSSGGGASILLDGTESEIIGTETNTSIQNGWRRISVTKTFASSGTKTLKLRLKNIRGIAYFDCLQLEKGEAPSGFCLTQNGHMELQNSWTGVGSYPIDANRGPSVCLSGNPDAANCASQTVQLNIPKETTLLLSGWGRAASAQTGEDDNGKDRTFRLTVRLHYTNNTTKDQHAEFNPDQTAWQFTSAAIIPKEDVDYAEIFLRYDYNVNSAYFDDVCLTVEPAQTYTHDANGNVESAKDALGNLTDPGYTGVDLTSLTLPVGSSYEYTYDTNHQVTSVIKTENGNEQTTDYVYDAFGNPTSATLTVEGYTGLMHESAAYSSDGNELLSVTDMLNGTTSYTFDATTKLLSAIEDANSHRTGYVYDSRYRIQKIYNDKDSDGVADSNEESVLYSYTMNELSGIQTATTGYTLQYDPFGNLKSVKAGNQTLASYTYGLYNGKIQRITYGNGSYEEYTYDHLDRVRMITYNGDSSKTQTFVYTSEGNVYSVTDTVAGILYLCEYDSLGRLIRGRQMKTSDGSVILETENRYDGYGRAAGSETALGSKTISYGIAYETGSDRVSSVSLPGIAGNASIGYTYDAFDRLTGKTTTLSGGSHSLAETYGYYSYLYGGTNRLTPLVNSVTLKKDGTATATYSYSYDQSGNITAVFENNYLVHSYEYDSLGQLTRENDAYAGKTWVYSYDKAGNLTLKDEYNYTTGTLSNCLDFDYYLYSSSTWGDLLTEYDGTTITYDAIGNPLNWRNATGLTWNGRKLTQATFNSMDSVAYTYTADGTRTRKVYNSGTMMESHIHDYVLDGTKILYEKYQISVMGSPTTHHLYYFYDENGSIAGLEYDGTPYYFQKDLQGDIVRICDGNGNTVVQYRYDAWGNVLSVTGSLANTLGQINPFRYRGYYYDTETGFYYLQTRYYDPQVGRFLNADSIIGANGGIIGFNLFAYCGNNPIPNVDFNGNQFLRWQDYDLGSMESTILFYWECYHYCQDNFGFTGDIDFDKLPLTKRQNSIDAFISAMEEVNFQAPPALIERYNAYVGSSIPVNSGTIRTASAGITISFGFVAVQISYVASESSESEIQSTVILNNSPSFSMTFGLTYSNAPNPSSMRGGTFFAGYGMPIFSTKYISISTSTAIGIMDNGYYTQSYGITVGLAKLSSVGSGYGVSWTF